MRAIARILMIAAAGCAGSKAAQKPPVAPGTAVARIDRDAEAVAPLVQSRWARDFLAAAHRLPAVAPRTLWRSGEPKSYSARWLTDEQARALAPAERARFVSQVADEELYYEARYGSPIAYARALEVLAQSLGVAAERPLAGTRLLDFGYGAVGQLRALARLGVDGWGSTWTRFCRRSTRAPTTRVRRAAPTARRAG
jgi:hypothetical protein